MANNPRTAPDWFDQEDRDNLTDPLTAPDRNQPTIPSEQRKGGSKQSPDHPAYEPEDTQEAEEEFIDADDEDDEELGPDRGALPFSWPHSY